MNPTQQASAEDPAAQPRLRVYRLLFVLAFAILLSAVAVFHHGLPPRAHQTFVAETIGSIVGGALLLVVIGLLVPIPFKPHRRLLVSLIAMTVFEAIMWFGSTLK